MVAVFRLVNCGINTCDLGKVFMAPRNMSFSEFVAFVLGLKGTALARLVLVVATAALLIYEVWSLLNATPGDTLSQGVWSFVDAFPVLLFVAGFLCGHWFWPRRITRVVSGPHPPQHVNCKSVLDESMEPQGYGNFSAPPDLLKAPRPDATSIHSMPSGGWPYVLKTPPGPPDPLAGITYQEWIAHQDSNVQDEILGKEAADFFRGRIAPRLISPGFDEALTPSASTKAEYIGEFSFNVETAIDSERFVSVDTVVPWTTVKQIMAAIRARAMRSQDMTFFLAQGIRPIVDQMEVGSIRSFQILKQAERDGGHPISFRHTGGTVKPPSD